MATEDRTAETLRVGIIGTGRPRGAEGNTGFGMAGAHAAGYNALPNCRIVALCDLVRERADAFNGENTGSAAAVYTDYHQMLAEERLDIVSVCTWPAQHAPMVIAAAAAAAGVRAIHCEKPIAPTWGESRRMVAACQERGVQLTFNHQRRFLDVFQRVRRLLGEGAIGELKRIEGACADLFDWGTHWLDMFGFYNDETAPSWVIAQVDVRELRTVFGLAVESQGIAEIRYENGVHARLATGLESNSIIGCAIRLIGVEGVLEIHWERPFIRLNSPGTAGWQILDDDSLNGGVHDNYANSLAIADLVDALVAGRKPLLDSSNALKSTSLIFGAYESARRRGRIDLPTDLESVEDSPLAALLESGAFPSVQTATNT